jgi:hypothetical protein
MVKYLIIILIFVSNSSLGCICANSISRLNDSIYNNALSIFVGEVISVENKSTINIIRIVVSDAIKKSNNHDTIEVITNADTGLCGLKIKEGEKWYFHINKIDNNNYFWEDICGRSIKLTKKKISKRFFDSEAKYYRKIYRKDKRKHKIERNEIKKIQKSPNFKT